MSRCARHLGAGLVLISLVLAGCSTPASNAASEGWQVTAEGGDSPLHGTLIDPPPPRPALRLQDTGGDWFSLADRPDGEVTAVFFGYTHCPDVCPTTMADLAAARRLLPAEVREKVTVAFVTEDPKRDTPDSLRRWLDRFDPSFVGLVGGTQETKNLMAELHLPPTKINESPSDPITHPETGTGHDQHGQYALEHPGIIYVFGPGDSSVIYTGGTTTTQYAEDFTRLASGAPLKGR